VICGDRRSGAIGNDRQSQAGIVRRSRKKNKPVLYRHKLKNRFLAVSAFRAALILTRALPFGNGRSLQIKTARSFLAKISILQLVSV
jgi:hypothetical protein